VLKEFIHFARFGEHAGIVNVFLLKETKNYSQNSLGKILGPF